jgi:hypothetical protein
MLAKKCFFVGIITMLSLSLVMAQDPPAVHPKTGEELVIDCLRGTPTIDGDLSDWNEFRAGQLGQRRGPWR